jgi:guanylate kinase
MEEKKSILILSGPVGAGKSTVARELVSSATGPIAFIEGDTFGPLLSKVV